jgi:hypothetical protein
MNKQLAHAIEVIESIAELPECHDGVGFEALRLQYHEALQIARDGLDFLKRNKETK